MRTFAQKENQPQRRVSSSRVRSNTVAPGPHPADPSLHSQRATGNQALQRMVQVDAEELQARLTGTPSPRSGHDLSRVSLHPPAAGAIQTKLEINQPGDGYEQEADHIAEQVMRTPERQLRRACPCGGGCPRCQKEQPGHEHERLQPRRLQSGNLGHTAVPPVVHEVLASPGQPLEAATRAFMEPRFGHDFSQVRVHADTRAAESAEVVKARAYTVGHDIVFGMGRFTPGTHEGRRLLAHELTHVVQQSIPIGSVRVPHSSGRREDVKHPLSRTRSDLLESVSILKLTSTPIQIARAPKPGGDKPGIHPDAMAFLEGKLRKFFELLSPRERIRLKRNSTIAIGMATVDGEPRLVYTVANNATSKEIRAAADKLDLHRWTYTTGVPGRGAVGAPNDAEQLMIESAKDNRANLHGIAVSRRVCPDCGEAIPLYKQGQIKVTVIEDPIPVPKGPRLAPMQPPAKTVSGDITVPDKPRSTLPTSAPPVVHPQQRVTPGFKAGFEPTLGRQIKFGLSHAGISALLGYVMSIAMGRIEESMFRKDCKALEPVIEKAVNKQQGEITKLLKMRKTIYANVRMEVVSNFVPSYDPYNPGGDYRYFTTNLIDVRVSTDNIRDRAAGYPKTVVTTVWWHSPLTYSFPIGDPIMAADMPAGFQSVLEFVAFTLQEILRNTSIRGDRFEGINENLHTALVMLGKAWDPDDMSKIWIMTDAKRFTALKSAVDKALTTMRTVFGTKPTKDENDLLAWLWNAKYQLDALHDLWPMELGWVGQAGLESLTRPR